jgi:hypothetical protein
MIELTIPGHGEIHIRHLMTDVNGALALDGILLDKPLRIIASLRQ